MWKMCNKLPIPEYAAFGIKITGAWNKILQAIRNIENQMRNTCSN